MLNHGLLMPRSHFEVIPLAEVRIGVGRRGWRPSGNSGWHRHSGERWSTLVWSNTVSLTLFIIAGMCEKKKKGSFILVSKFSVDNVSLYCLYGADLSQRTDLAVPLMEGSCRNQGRRGYSHLLSICQELMGGRDELGPEVQRWV